jgi:hypothetical protein
LFCDRPRWDAITEDALEETDSLGIFTPGLTVPELNGTAMRPVGFPLLTMAGWQPGPVGKTSDTSELQLPQGAKVQGPPGPTAIVCCVDGCCSRNFIFASDPYMQWIGSA